MRRMYSKPQLLEAVEQESKINGIKVFEDIKDKDGHDRFIEGELNTVAIEGVEYTYKKWSLSGTHLMLVLAGSFPNGSTISSYLSQTELPSWIMDKIVPVALTRLEYKTFVAYNNEISSSQQVGVSLNKDSGKLQMYATTPLLTDKRYFRISFDLLIDDE